MAGFLKIKYIANGLLKNRIISTNSIDLIEPFDAPGGRYVGETRSRIFMKDGTKYDMSLTIDEIHRLLREAGVGIAELQSLPPEPPAKSKSAAPPAAPIAFYKRSTLIKPQQPGTALVKPAHDAARKPLPPAALVKDAGAAKPPVAARKPAETVRG